MIEKLTQVSAERSRASGGKLGLSHAEEVLCPFYPEEGCTGIVYLAWILKLLNSVWEVKCWDNCQKPKSRKFHRVRFKHGVVLQVLCVLPVGLCILIWYLMLGASVTFNSTSHFLSRENRMHSEGLQQLLSRHHRVILVMYYFKTQAKSTQSLDNCSAGLEQYFLTQNSFKTMHILCYRMYKWSYPRHIKTWWLC